MTFGDRLGREQELALHFDDSPQNALSATRNFSIHLKLLLRLLARFSLRTNHALGAFIGRAVYVFSPRYRTHVLENLGSSGLCPNREALHSMAKRNAAEIGKGATELAWALFRPL